MTRHHQTHGSVPQAGKGSATLSMAYAAAAFANSCLRAMGGEDGVVDCAYVESNVVPGLPFFAGRLRLGPHGVAERLPLGPLNDLESRGLEVQIKRLRVICAWCGVVVAVGRLAFAPLLSISKPTWEADAVFRAVAMSTSRWLLFAALPASCQPNALRRQALRVVGCRRRRSRRSSGQAYRRAWSS